MGAGGAAIVGGSAVKAYGAYESSQAEARGLEDEANVLEENAVMALKAGKFNAEKQQLQATKIFGSMRANYAASGVSLDSGSALEVMRESHVNAELDRQNIIYGSELKAQNMRRQAAAARSRASDVKRAGEISAFGTLFSGFASAGGL